MGLSASQARFLQLTARKSNVEYEAQQITFQRLELASQLETISMEFQNKMSNRKLVYAFNNGVERTDVDLTYTNYKNYMNQQLEGVVTSQDQYFLVSSSGKKIIAASEEDIQTIIDKNEGKGFTRNDFLIVDNLDDVDNFQQSLRDGLYYFAKYQEETGDDGVKIGSFKTESIDTLGAGAISDVYDKSDDDVAQAEYDRKEKEIQKKDKMLEMTLEQLTTERNALQTEIDGVSKVIEDNIEKSFQTFG